MTLERFPFGLSCLCPHIIAATAFLCVLISPVFAQQRDSSWGVGPDITPVQDENKSIELAPSFAPSNRVFLLPTANPIGAGKGFISDNELMFLYGGVGIGDYVSLTAGMSTLPVVNLASQLITSQLKISLAETGAANVAIGVSASWLTSQYFFSHVFVNTTFLYDTMFWVTGMAFYRMTGPDIVDISFGKYGSFSFPYQNSFGVAVGLEARPSKRTDMRFIGEVWIAPGAAFMGGVRFGNDVMEETFGFVLPFIPVISTSFHW